MKLVKLFALMSVLSIIAMAAGASDRSDATDLMNQCDKESKIVEIPTKNFGDEKDIANFVSGLDLIKQGKVKLAQSKFLDAKAKFEDYLKLQKTIYESISAKYIQRAGELIDKIAEDLADFAGEELVLKNFATASRQLDNAKALAVRKQYENVIQPCRISKNSVITVYTMVKKDIPNEYERDIADFNNKIFEAEKKK